MKRIYNILVSVDNKALDVISYESNEQNYNKEKILVTNFINKKFCDVKSTEEMTNNRLTIVSKKDNTYKVSWKRIYIWDESRLH